MSQVMLLGEEQAHFFPGIVDVALLITALFSTVISLLIPCLFYLKKQCRDHPTVLIANISLLQSIANFNIVLMAVDIFAYEDYIDIAQVFHFLTFDRVSLPSPDENADFCVYNYCVYMLVELLSLSFHICYSVDLLITIKFPFVPGRKRRKYYYAFAVVLPLVTLANSIQEAPEICAKELALESIFKVPFWFLVTLVAFCMISVVIVLLSWMQKRSTSHIRSSYIKQHRSLLCLLVLLWAAPIWTNILILKGDQGSELFDIVNKVAFFCIIGSSGVMNLIRMCFDRYLRKKVINMVLFRDIQDKAEESKHSQATDQVWNLPLAGAMREFQSQEIVNNIIQVVCQACSARPNVSSHLRESHVRSGWDHSEHSYGSVDKNTIIIQHDGQSVEHSISKLFTRRQELKYENMDPHDGTIEDLKQLSRMKRKFNMVCLSSMLTTQDFSERFGQKTVHMKSQLMQSEKIHGKEANQLLSIHVTSYCHRIFETLRAYDHFTPQQVAQTLDPQKNFECIRRAKESLGASGSFFFFSADHRVVIKTITEEEKDRFVALLPHYFDHIRYNEHSLLARTYGIFAVEIQGVSKIYFTLMENSFRDLQQAGLSYQIYDLKGSTVQRQVKDPAAPVLKDINYFRSPDCFLFLSAENKYRLLDQASKDVEMLRKHNIMDYSLLLGVARSQCRIKKRELYARGIQGRRVENFRMVRELQEVTKKVYSISLIDYLQEYNFSKKLELWFKRIFKGGGDISSVSSDLYYRRFMAFLARAIVVLNVKFQKMTPFPQTVQHFQ